MRDSPNDPLARLHVMFGDRLYNDAERLVDAGSVSDVRVLQAGNVVTGIAGTGAPDGQRAGRHRVYIQFHDSRTRLEGECSCGEHSPCIHVAAVSIAAATAGAKPAAGHHPASTESMPRAPAQHGPRGAPAQRLCYLLDSTADRTGALQLSVWVGQVAPGDGRVDGDSICGFEPRPAEGSGEFPRFVDAQDAQILRSLIARHFTGPWELQGSTSATLLQRVVATGRAFWHSLQERPLQPGKDRRVQLAWHTLPDGAQQLSCEDAQSIVILENLEPVSYLDTGTHEVGRVDLPCSSSLLRHYWSRPAIAPEDVETVNRILDQQIASEGAGVAFPRLRPLPVDRQSRRSLQPRLVLSPEPRAALHFIYNGLAVDADSLGASHDTARRFDGAVVHEIDRDRDAEQRWRLQLVRALEPVRREAESWLAFVMNELPALQADGWEVVIEERFPYRLVTAGDWYADVHTERRGERQRDWFDVRLGVLVDGQPVNLLPALVNYLQADLITHDASLCRVGEHLLVSLGDGRYLPVPLERIRRIAETLVELLERDALSKQQALSLPASQASRLALLTQDLGAPTLQTDDGALRALIEDLKNFSGIQPLAAPENFQAELRPYQQEGLGWLQFLRRYRLGGILADDMGLGKTVQTLAHLVLEKREGRLLRPSLIVAPVSVIGNWQQEVRRFAPELRALTLHGAKRRELFHAIPRSDVVIIGYPALQLDNELLLAHEFCFVILDEAQTIKNPRAKVSQAARALRAEHRLCLTGTPMENHLGELWSLFDFLQPGFLGTEKEFQRQYRVPVEKNADERRAAALNRRIAPFLLRRTKDAVARELPPKTQIVESIVLDERQRDFYDAIRLAMHQRVRDIIQHQGLARSQITVLDALLKLRQACCDPRLVKLDTLEVDAVPSAKMDWLCTVLPELVAEGRRILLFSQFTSMLRLIEAAVQSLAIPYCLLTGETQQRSEQIQRFQSGAVPLFLISLKAGGTGLNLTTADTVIHYDPWWNPAAEAQATDRAHRIGQEQPVFVYKLIAQGTVEERIMQLQADKQALASQLYTEASAAPTQLSAADLDALFAP